MNEHDYWEEQAAGYALDALEPDEAAEFVLHLAECDECRQRVDEHALVAAQLGAVAYDDRPAPQWSALRSGIVGGSAEPSSNVVPIHRRRAAAWMSAAAAAVAIVVGVTLWQTSGGGGRGPLTSVSACAGSDGCHVVALRAGNRTAASVLVDGRDVALVSSTMPHAPSGSEWALWRVSGDGSPTLMTVFAEAGGTRALLDVPYADISAFAVSREPAGTTPTTPSVVVASGTVA